jgi:predicted transcriptional regulator
VRQIEEFLVNERKTMGLSRNKAAADANVSLSLWQRLEKNPSLESPRWSSLQKIFNSLGWSISIRATTKGGAEVIVELD